MGLKIVNPGEQLPDEEAKLEEKDTPSDSSEDNKPATEPLKEDDDSSKEEDDSTKEDDSSDSDTDTDDDTKTDSDNLSDVEKQERRVQGLKDQEDKLLENISTLRSERRQIKDTDKPLIEGQKKVEPDDLKDLDPEAVKWFDRVLKAKGVVTQSELHQKTIDTEKDRWLKEHPDLLPANDPNDVKWNAFKANVGLLRMPEKADDIRKAFDMAYQAISPTVKPQSVTEDLADKQQKVKTASRGSSAGSGSPSNPSLDDFDAGKVVQLRQGGWSEKEIVRILSKLKK